MIFIELDELYPEQCPVVIDADKIERMKPTPNGTVITLSNTGMTVQQTVPQIVARIRDDSGTNTALST